MPEYPIAGEQKRCGAILGAGVIKPRAGAIQTFGKNTEKDHGSNQVLAQ
jgi:hypothetical protein